MNLISRLLVIILGWVVSYPINGLLFGFTWSTALWCLVGVIVGHLIYSILEWIFSFKQKSSSRAKEKNESSTEDKIKLDKINHILSSDSSFRSNALEEIRKIMN